MRVDVFVSVWVRQCACVIPFVDRVVGGRVVQWRGEDHTLLVYEVVGGLCTISIENNKNNVDL